MITNTPYNIKAGVSPEDFSLFDVTWITADSLMLITRGSPNNKVLVNDTVVPDTRQFEVYRSIKGTTVAVVRYGDCGTSVYREIKTSEQLELFFGNSQQANEIYQNLGYGGNPLRKSMHMSTAEIPIEHRTSKYLPLHSKTAPALI